MPNEGGGEVEIHKMLDGRLPAGHYTDDTEMMIGVAESLIDKRGFDGRHMAFRFVKNYNSFRGYGFGATQVLKSIGSGMPWDEASKKLFEGLGSYGNGAAMRIAPVGIVYYDNIQELRSTAEKVSRITHSHELGVEGAILQAYAVALAASSTTSTKLEANSFLKKLDKFVGNNVFKEKLQRLRQLLTYKPSRAKVVVELGNGIEAFNSVPTAIYSFLSHSSSFKESVVYAVGLGGDADTIGAMAGAISGAYHGVESIPEGWKNGLENISYLEKLAEKLWLLNVEG